MMLAKVKEQDGIMLSLQSIPTSAACCDDVQLTNTESSFYTFTIVDYFIGLRPPNTATCSLFTTVNYFIGLRPPKHRYLQLFTTVNYFIGLRPTNTDTSSYLQLSTTSSDCVLLNTCTSSYLQPSITPSDCILLQAADVYTYDFYIFKLSIIPSCSFTFLRVIPTLFGFFLLKLFYFTCSCYFFDHYQFELNSCMLDVISF